MGQSNSTDCKDSVPPRISRTSNAARLANPTGTTPARFVSNISYPHNPRRVSTGVHSRTAVPPRANVIQSSNTSGYSLNTTSQIVAPPRASSALNSSDHPNISLNASSAAKTATARSISNTSHPHIQRVSKGAYKRIAVPPRANVIQSSNTPGYPLSTTSQIVASQRASSVSLNANSTTNTVATPRTYTSPLHPGVVFKDTTSTIQLAVPPRANIIQSSNTSGYPLNTPSQIVTPQRAASALSSSNQSNVSLNAISTSKTVSHNANSNLVSQSVATSSNRSTQRGPFSYKRGGKQINCIISNENLESFEDPSNNSRGNLRNMHSRNRRPPRFGANRFDGSSDNTNQTEPTHNRRHQSRNRNTSRGNTHHMSNDNSNLAAAKENTWRRSRGNSNQDGSMENLNRQRRNGGNRNVNNDDTSGRRVGFFGFKKLEELLTKCPEEALIAICNKKDALLAYLNSNQMSPDVMVLMFEVLGLVINSTFAEVVTQLLLALCNDNFFEPISNYILSLPIHDSTEKNRGRRFWNAPEQFFQNIALVIDALIEILPTTAMDIVPKMLNSILYTIPNIEEKHRLIFNDTVKADFEELQVKMSMLTTKEEEKKKHRREEDPDEPPPPNDFRDIDVYPTSLEITARNELPYLRKNKIKGAYQDVNHYLDVQYRLLREDFVAPLREGICDYLENMNDQGHRRLSNIKIYKNVICVAVVPNVNQIGYLVQAFKPNSIKNLDNSRRFMFGSLICLTTNNFKTIIFGKIIDRDQKYLKEGQLVLGFDVGIDLEINRSYIMVECTVYFEPYYQVLTALKHMSVDKFPLKEYLVDVQVESERPNYLVNREIPASSWPLNNSQLDAFNAALSKKFCIIQGPPGTGKTYLGLRVARSLLKHKAVWHRAPMLVICYTNHALDQFLEGLLEQTENLVRVGGQSKNEKLEKYNLRKLRAPNIPIEYSRLQRTCRAQMECTARELRFHTEALRAIDEFKVIINFNLIKMSDVDQRYANSWFASESRNELLQWLLYQPHNKNDVKFADYEQINEMIREEKLKEENGDDEENEDDDDDPMNSKMKQNKLQLDDELIDIDYAKNQKGIHYLSLLEMHQEITEVIQLLRQLNSQEYPMEYLNLTRQLIKMRIDYDYVFQQLNMLKQLKGIPDDIYIDYDDPHDMPVRDRWLLYGRWISLLREKYLQEYVKHDTKYREYYREFSEVKDMLDLYKMKSVDVVGMTTTGAARLHKTLQALECPIVIVEEAAEVLEAHIITALSPKCEHLILIGDHKQLKPSTADYKITKHFHLGVSLFERMVENGLHCYTLNVQHRMRPEIANLVCPSIYPNLINHDSVLLSPRIRGVDTPLFFITHSNLEQESSDKSKENVFEAEYLINLARYLALNNYDASRITIIAAYSGQWFVMNRLKKKHSILRGMRICILDNFQGEENDIILLSLVRNNEEGKNGFLDLENRICVALSRAKYGLYIMGNISQLCAKNKIWQQVSEVLQKYDALGEYLTIRCENHPESITHLRNIVDFQKVPEGGCLKSCGKALVCGHNCVKICHSTSHDNYKCHQPCTKVLCGFGHICPDKCYMDCSPCMVPKFSTLPCGHSMDIPCHKSPDEIECPVKLSTKLPCEHTAEKPCFEDIDKFKCPFPCSRRLEPCGHACRQSCHVRNDPHHEKYKCLQNCVKTNKNCTMPEDFQHFCEKRCCEKCDLCPIKRKKERNCGHFYEAACHADVDEVVCKKPCKRTLPCGHECKNKCDQPCGPCKVKVPKTIPECGHTIQWECDSIPDKKACKNKNCPLILPCGHKCNLPCASDCSKAKCTELVPYSLLSPCSHSLQVACHMKNVTTITNQLLSTCQSKCVANLACGHDCPGTCGACAQGRFHASCNEKCSKILICGHECTMPCVENCKPCRQQCKYYCEHSKCTKDCGALCTPCSEPCNRRCIHQRCTATCGKKCTVPPCMEPCQKLLPCRHTCVGFCGDDCPPLCRICDKDELTEIFFGTEDEEDARFVYLPDCKHTLESTGMENMLQIASDEETNQEIKMLTCPKCKTPISTLRYRDYIKEAFEDISRVKQEYFGHPRELLELKRALKAEVATLQAVAGVYKHDMKYFEEILKAKRKGNTQRREHSKADLISIRARFDIFKELINKRQSVQGLKDKALELVHEQLVFLLGKLFAEEVSINESQIAEFQTEILRYHRIMQLANILHRNPNILQLREYKLCNEILFAFKKYNQHQDDTAKQRLEALNKVANTGMAVTDAERKEIVAALKLSPGHWFKCPNGHYYIITECGGAMQIGKCPECGSRIGGTNHALLNDNRFAPEMDQARAPAFPTLNDINMYRL